MNHYESQKENINNTQYINPFRKKRNYNEMIQQDKSAITSINFNFKRPKEKEGISHDTLIKNYKPKIPERLRKEIELYNYQRRGLYLKILPCKCEK